MTTIPTLNIRWSPGFATGAEGSPISLTGLTVTGAPASRAAGGSLRSLVVSLIPVGATLSDGHGHTFTATSGHASVDVHTWDLAALTIVAPDDRNFQLNATATDILGNTASLAAPISVTVAPLAPTLAPVAAVGVEGAAVALSLGVTINSRSGDTNSLASLMVSAIPAGAILSDGTNTFKATSGNTSVDVHAWNLSSLTITPANDANFALTVAATEKDAEGDLSATATATETVMVKPSAPALSWAASVSGVGGAPIALGALVATITGQKATATASPR